MMLYALYGMRKAEYAQASKNTGPTRGNEVRIHNFWNSHTHARVCYLSCSRYIQSSIIGVACGSTTHVPTTAANLCFSIITLRITYRNVGDDLTSTPEFSCMYRLSHPSYFLRVKLYFSRSLRKPKLKIGKIRGYREQALLPHPH